MRAGIDPERFTAAMEAEEVQMNIAKLLNRYAGRKVMLGVDRLDMIKARAPEGGGGV